MSDKYLDEDGLCRTDGLPPEWCGCAHHRGGEEVTLEEPHRGRKAADAWDRSYESFDIRYIQRAEHVSECALDAGHEILVGHEIGRAVDEKGHHVGWVCPECTRQILENGETEAPS